jgi:DNA-binding transcriptional regulator YiaG
MTAVDIQRMRRRHGLSQGQLARLLGCSPKTISGWETARRAIPRRAALAILALDFASRHRDLGAAVRDVVRGA